MLVFINAYRKILQAHRITVVAFHPEVFRVSYFHRNGGTLVASLSKDNTRVEFIEVEMDSKVLGSKDR